MLLNPIPPVSVLVNGPATLFSRTTMSVDAAPVSTAMTPRMSAAGHGCPTDSIPSVTSSAAPPPPGLLQEAAAA